MVSRMPFPEQDAQTMPQVLCVGEKDSKRLLEAYVKRSLSLNDGSQHPSKKDHGAGKRTTPQRAKKERKHSSDTSLHLTASGSLEDLGDDEAFSEPETGRRTQTSSENTHNKSKQWKKRGTLSRNDGSSASRCSDGKSTGMPHKLLLHFTESMPESCGTTVDALSQSLRPDQLESSTEMKKLKEGKKSKKPSILKSVLGWFTRGNNDKQEEQNGDEVRTEEALASLEPSTPPTSCLPLYTGDAAFLRQTKSKKKRSQRRFSFKRRSGDMGLDKATGRPLTLDLATDAQNHMVKSIKELEPTSSYYEKVTEELQKIVNEVKNSPAEENRTFSDSLQPSDIGGSPISQEEVTKRVIYLIKEEGDLMDSRLKENPIVSSFFRTLSYGAFQKLADQYVKSEVCHQTAQPPIAAPELVKFAFTLDFTARVAGLSRHAPGHILGFGNQYLSDRFTYMSESKPHLSDLTTAIEDNEEKLRQSLIYLTEEQ